MKKAQTMRIVGIIIGIMVLIALISIFVISPFEVVKTWLQGLPGQDSCRSVDDYISSIDAAINAKDYNQADELFVEFNKCHPSEVEKRPDVRKRIDDLKLS